MAQPSSTRAGPQRRGLLAALGTVAAPAIATAATQSEPDRADVVPPGMARKESEEEKRKPRYRETDHVRAFYRTNRY